MAKRTKTSSRSGGSQKSRSLVYEESYYKNRNDMLQSSLDSVYQRIDSEQLAYEARLKATKDLTRALDKELQRLRKMRDDLDVRQLDKNAASQQWSAGQRNSARRTEFLVTATASRFLADKAFDRGMYASGTKTKAAGIPGLDETIENESNRIFTLYPDDPNAGIADLRAKIRGVGEFAKSDQQVDLATANYVDKQVTSELEKLDRGEGDADQVAVYQQFAGDAKAQRGIAVQLVLNKFTDPAIVASATRGYQIAEEMAKKKGAGVSDEELGKMVATGRIAVESAGAPNYDDIKAGLDTRIAKLEADISGITPEAPVPLSERNIIEEQRDEYFRTFYPSATPAYQTNRLMQNILSGNLDPQSEAIIMDILAAEGKAGRMPAEGPLGPEIENAGARRGFSGKQGPRMPGDIIYGEGSPFVPEESPLSDKALRILSNEGLNQFFGEGLSEAKIQKRADDLFDLGLGMTRVTKEDGKVLYTVVPYNRLGSFKPEDVVMPTRPESTTVEGLNQQISALQKEMAAATAGAAGGLSPFNIFASLADPTSLGVAGMQSLAGKQAALDSLIAQRDALLPGRKDISREDMRKAQENVRMDQSQPLDQSIDDLVQELARIDVALKKAYSPVPVSPDVAGLGPVSSKEQVSALESSKRSIEDQLDNLLMRRIEAGSGQEQEVVKRSDMVFVPARSYLGDFGDMGTVKRETEPVFDFGEPRRVQPPGQPNILFTGDRAEVRRILNDPERQRYKAPFKVTEPPAPTIAPGSNQPPAGPAIRRPTGISYPPISPDVQQTPDGRDASFKINALESAAKLVDNDELGRTLRTPVGSAVEQLYKANKAKGNQTDKELLGYIAKEFPRVEDQKTAATALFGLSYKDQLSGKLG